MTYTIFTRPITGHDPSQPTQFLPTVFLENNHRLNVDLAFKKILSSTIILLSKNETFHFRAKKENPPFPVHQSLLKSIFRGAGEKLLLDLPSRLLFFESASKDFLYVYSLLSSRLASQVT